MRQEYRRTISQLAWSLVIVAAAWGATEILYHVDRPLQQHGVFAFFLAAIAIASWRGGLLPALFTVALTSLMVAWYLPPDNSFRIASQEDVVRLVLFVGLGLLISYLHYARNRAEKSLQETDRRLRLSLDSSGVACWDADVKGGIFWKSHNLPEIFGRSTSEFATTYEGFFAYIHPEDREFFHLASVGSSNANHRDFEISHRIICGDGSIRRVSTRGRMYLDHDGRVERMVGAVFSVESKLATPGSSQPPANSPGSFASLLLV
jgi:PAS domain-containing protein